MSILSLFAFVSTLLGLPPIQEGGVVEKVPYKVPTTLETRCYSDEKCRGGYSVVKVASQCKGEHHGVRLVIIYTYPWGKKEKRAPCVPGEFFDIPDHVQTPGQKL